MADLYLGFAIIGGLTVALFCLALRVSHEIPQRVGDALALLVVIGMFFYIRHLWYDVRLASWLPVSNLIIVGNWLPLAAGLLGGFAWHRVSGRFVRKTVVVCSLGAAAAYAMLLPTLGAAPVCGDVWRDGICVQTTNSTCTAACAATLLKLHGIETTEAEMAELCLTRDGTTWMGLYRGLKTMTEGTRWDVEVVECDVEQLVKDSTTPVILSVGLLDDASQPVEPRFEEWGWRPGERHSVLLLGKHSSGSWRIADPAPGYGIEHWDGENLRQLFQGTAVRLVERP